ncbi:peroxisomal carnitine O-octanoyltransferase-like [Oppia nitens]|uniref:peroxisomal carnitine O-octanoyltransferase-like n=1 Tax=Oppia nitens TaxID=1686743 RepID=UPI0023DBA70C|nr:peroxisomal carnitine O-octanoyltransferase-like [Oppia nitens]
MSLKETLFKSTKHKTFANEESLPSLPVPTLRPTLDVYLDSVRAVVDGQQYEATEEICRQFESGIGKQLQDLFEKRTENSKNWLTDWWLEYAYLMQRLPLIPYSNMTGVQPNFDFWPLKTGTGIKRLALMAHFSLDFYQLLRKEQLKATRVRNAFWSMDQFKYLYNTCRIPGPEKDTLKNTFKTESEGPIASTITIVLYRGYIFAFDNLVNGQFLTAPEIEIQLNYIENWCQSQTQSGPGVGSLTSTDRTKWAENRKYLQQLTHENEKYLNIIEDALSVCALDDNQPNTPLKTCYQTACGNCVDRWADKSITLVAYRNGNLASSADHTPFDAMSLATLSQYINLSVFETKGEYYGQIPDRKLPVPMLLDFQIDDKLRTEITKAQQSYRTICDGIDYHHEVFKDYGRSLSAKHRIHPEAYIQIAMQLAYYRLHGKPAPTYCTATTRRFYKGRTETCRTCTPEAVEFAISVIKGNSDNNYLFNLLLKAGQKFQQSMTNACNGQGCDRHFLGLYVTSVENNIELPELFTDSSFMQSGGSGTYVLSTSCSGYWKSCGGMPPMREDGYSCFYGIENHQYSFNIMTFKSCPDTSAQRFYDSLRQSLLEMRNILDSQKSNSTTLQHNL